MASDCSLNHFCITTCGANHLNQKIRKILNFYIMKQFIDFQEFLISFLKSTLSIHSGK